MTPEILKNIIEAAKYMLQAQENADEAKRQYMKLVRKHCIEECPELIDPELKALFDMQEASLSCSCDNED